VFNIVSADLLEPAPKLRIFVHAVYHLGPYPDIFGGPPNDPKWCELFNKLASEATKSRPRQRLVLA
jgi:hypothetical protein